MLRRLYFLFPDEMHAQRVINQLIHTDVPESRFHAISRGVKLQTLPEATDRQKNDTAFKIENFFWILNLSVFAFATLILFVALLYVELTWVVSSVILMLATFFAGKQFVLNIPGVHLTEFTDALSHGEILLMVDVPISRVAEVESFVHYHHPEAAFGGESWSVDVFGI